MTGAERKQAAAFFDHLYTTQRTDDIEFYRNRAERAGEPVLELGCGTGRVYLSLLREGIDVDGFDIRQPDLELLREKAREEGLDPNVWQADMTDFSVDREYQLVICPFNAFLQLLTHDDQRATLSCVHDALAPGGKFIFDVFVPSFDIICETYGEWQTQTIEYDGDTYEYRTRSRLVDEIRQDVLVENEVYGPTGDLFFSDNHRMTLLPKSELELLVETSPFDTWSATGDYAEQQLADGDSVQVWTLTKM